MQTQGSKIQELLKHRGLLQNVFAGEIGWNPAALSKKIGSGKDFSADDIKRISAFFGLKSEFFMKRSFEYRANQDVPEWAMSESVVMVQSLEERLKRLEKCVFVEDTAFQGRVLTMLSQILELVSAKQM